MANGLTSANKKMLQMFIKYHVLAPNCSVLEERCKHVGGAIDPFQVSIQTIMVGTVCGKTNQEFPLKLACQGGNSISVNPICKLWQIPIDLAVTSRWGLSKQLKVKPQWKR